METGGKGSFTEAYQGLNKEQKRAVDAIDGPVMVIAGPGTGKTQVLALRIANILDKTDTPAHGILALTFTRAGVKAMRERLVRYIGSRAREVSISTFHSFALNLVEKHYSFLDFDHAPALIDDQRGVALIDELLEDREWKYLRPRGDVSRYFDDLRTLVSLMKREGISADRFRTEIDIDIATLKESPDSISSRGETKGQLKKEVLKKIEGLERTKEVISFYESYEQLKRDRLLMDYDDVLSYAVRLVQESDDARADIRESYLYVLVDEHQDSSGVQNSFLKAVWQDTDRPNIFVVGDDRQLIYGFGGASLSYFEDFKTAFGKAELIALIENYRSTAPILSLADELLKSSLTTDSLRSNRTGDEKVQLQEYSYARDEIIAAAIHFRKAVESGTPAHDCVLLVPRNRHIRTAVQVLRDMGLPVRSERHVSLFAIPETESLRRVWRVVADPHDNVALAQTLFDPLSDIPPLDAHSFLRSINTKKLSVETLLSKDTVGNLFESQDPVNAWGQKLSGWIDQSVHVGLEPLVHAIGNELLVDTAHDHATLMRRIEVVRTMLHLASARAEENPKITLMEFLQYLDRLETYGHALPVATLLGGQGISVLTLHGSKGLEFENVWIAHLNESILMSQKKLGFTLPSSIEEMVEARDRAVATREVYVAITRAKTHCTISYSRASATEAELELAHLIADLPDSHFEKKSAEETESGLVAMDPKLYVSKQKPIVEQSDMQALIETVQEEYTEKRVSVSLLNNFFECPWKWYFRNLLDLQEIKTEQQLFGSAVHRAVETILKGELKSGSKDIREAISEYLEKEGIKEPAALVRLSKEGTGAVLGWTKHYLPHLSKDYVTERPLSYKDPKLPHLTMFGKIDLTERFPDGTIAVTDFKTGSAKTSGAIEKHDDEGRLSSHLRQLAMYSYLIKGSEKNDVTSARLLYIEEDPKEKNALYTTRITEEQIDLLKRDIAEYDELVRTGKWLERPCCYKPFGKDTECEYCKWAREVYKK
jgi:DNA helicase-2/ATP-dependent DNA helicase PcrA